MLDRISRELGEYIGPLAKVLVQRAAKKSTNLEDLGKLLETEIPSAADRNKFVDSLRRLGRR